MQTYRLTLTLFNMRVGDFIPIAANFKRLSAKRSPLWILCSLFTSSWPITWRQGALDSVHSACRKRAVTSMAQHQKNIYLLYLRDLYFYFVFFKNLLTLFCGATCFSRSTSKVHRRPETQAGVHVSVDGDRDPLYPHSISLPLTVAPPHWEQISGSTVVQWFAGIE